MTIDCSRDKGQRRQRRRPGRRTQELEQLRQQLHQHHYFSSQQTTIKRCATTNFGAHIPQQQPIQGYNCSRSSAAGEDCEDSFALQATMRRRLLIETIAAKSAASKQTTSNEAAHQHDLKFRNLVNSSTLNNFSTIKVPETRLNLDEQPVRNRTMMLLNQNERRHSLFVRPAFFSSAANIIARLAIVLLAVFLCCFLTSHMISCQLQAPPTFDGAEARADSPLKPQANALDQLVKLLNSYANQQQPGGIQQSQQRRPALPLNSINIQRPQPIPVSTPVNPFSLPQFQSNRRVNFPNQQQSSNNNNQPQQPMFVSSSPPTPYLTLNRIASLANQNQNSNNQNRAFQIQPINTIPLGSLNNNNQQQQQQQNRVPMMLSPPLPTRQQSSVQQQQLRPQFGQQLPQRPMFSTPVPVPLPPSLLGAQSAQANANSVKPISGFAPSGPPPSLAANNAMVVVESPTNAIGQLPGQQQGSAGSEQGNKTTGNNRQEASSRSPQSTGETADQAEESSVPAVTAQEDDRTTLAPVTLIASSNRPAESTSTSLSSSPVPPTTIVTTSSSSSEQDQKDQSKETSTQWNPVELNRTVSGSDDQQQQQAAAINRNKVTLLPSPDIVTVPPGYNPDSQASQPQSYDIAVSAQMPTSNQRQMPPAPPSPTTIKSAEETSLQALELAAASSTTTEKPASRYKLDQQPNSDYSSPLTLDKVQSSSSSDRPLPSIAPTAVTTIFWSPPSNEGAIQSSTLLAARQPMATNRPSQVQPSRVIERGQLATLTPHSPQQPSLTHRIRDNSMIEDGQTQAKSASGADIDKQNSSAGVVYGKVPARDSKPTPPNNFAVSPEPIHHANIESSVSAGAGKPFIQAVQIDNQVRPYSAGAQAQDNQHDKQQPALLKSNHGHSSSSSSSSSSLPFRPSKPLNHGISQSSMSIGSAFTITSSGNQTMPTGDIQDYVAGQPPLLVPSLSSPAPPTGSQITGSFHVTGDHEPTVSAHGGQDPSTFDHSSQQLESGHSSHAATSGKTHGNSTLSDSSSSRSLSTVAPTQRVRRPTFKPKPAVPPIRIDSCIVGDDSSCDQSHNERCVTEYGISSCHCKPGFARLSQLRGYCSPVSLLQLSMKIDRLSDDRRLVYNQTLDNSNTEEYQYLEFETIQALASAFQQTSLAKQFMGARVNKFFERKGKVWVNMSVNFEANELSKTDKILNVAAQELQKVVQGKAQKPLGDSTVVLDGSKETVSRLVDINECANRDLNDCSKYATCTNDFGGFHCQCISGYEDKYLSEDRSKHGRVCLGCSPSYCSNRGECSIIDGQKQCKCRPNFIGSKCDIDSEVLAVAVGGSLVGIIILVITFWCLYVFNRRWKREQQKMDAMSATSGLTFNYVNSSTNSLMSPSSARVVGGHRSGGAGHQVGALAANYGQRFGAAIVNGTRVVSVGQQHGYAPDQQAIIGSASSGSSAASQPIACNPYAPNYQYEDAGLLIAPASTGSSEQTSPSGNSYRAVAMATCNQTMMAGNSYTLSGHHHHHHHHLAHSNHLHHSHLKPGHQQITQFHPAADFRTLSAATMQPQQQCATTTAYDNRWRTMQQQQQDNKHQAPALVGYYLSPDMLMNQQQQNHLQQLYASPQRELCIDTGGHNNDNRARKQPGRGTSATYGQQTMRSRKYI